VAECHFECIIAGKSSATLFSEGFFTGEQTICFRAICPADFDALKK
jgi:hypothetical protein